MQFSVIIPTCHRNADLAACLRLLAPGAQSLPAADYEVIVSDDGRTSTAEAMVKQQFPWARWVPGPQRGPASNRNCGARSAGGKWLVFTDDDCLPSRDWLAAYAAAATDEARVLEGKTVACGFRDRLDMECPVNETGGYLWSCNFAVRHDVFVVIGGFDEDFPGAAAEDMDLHERLKAAGYRVAFLPAAQVSHPWRVKKDRPFWRIHAESVARFAWKHPQLRARFQLWSQVRMLAGREARGLVQAVRQFGGRGWVRQVALDVYWFACFRRAMYRQRAKK